MELLRSAYDFRVDTVYPDDRYLTAERQHLRNYPAPWIRKTIELLGIIKARVAVEIGSTRLALGQACIDYFESCQSADPHQPGPFRSERDTAPSRPECCLDGHSTYFWARAGLETHTVDVDARCRDVIAGQYAKLREPIPDNLHVWVPRDGIDFLAESDLEIDFLYLDGWDVGTERYAEMHLEAYLAAEPLLAASHLISIDDADFAIGAGGKDRVLGPNLIDRGYVPLLSGRQKVFFSPVM